MAHTLVKIDGRKIVGWGTFHDVFSKAFELPEAHPRNMSAWMNTMYVLDDPAKSTAGVRILPGEILVIELENVDEFVERCPQQYAAILECVAQVNLRRIEGGAAPIMALAYFKN